MISKIIRRIKNDYFLKNRIEEYEFLIRKALDKGFEILPHSKFYELVKNKQLNNRKILMIRQDIDTNPNYCKHWLRVEKKYNIHTSYYFRLCTINIPIMKEIIEYGSDCGYHYEELATYAKRFKLKNSDSIELNLQNIKNEFNINLKEIESRLGSKITYIASHGDFANRKLKIPNHYFVDRSLLDSNGLVFEAYDREFLENYDINIMDAGGPLFYNGPISQLDALDNYNVIHLLIHPRHWKSSFYWSTYENLKRLIQGIKY
jgi:hypothetical protein